MATGHTPPGATLWPKGAAGLRLLATSGHTLREVASPPTGQRRGRAPLGEPPPLTGHPLATHWPPTGHKGTGGQKQASPTPTPRLATYTQHPSPLFPLLPMWPHNPQKTGEGITASYITTCAEPSRLTHVFGEFFSVFFFLFSPPLPPLSFSFFHHLKVQENMGNMGSRLITQSLSATFVFPSF